MVLSFCCIVAFYTKWHFSRVIVLQEDGTYIHINNPNTENIAVSDVESQVLNKLCCIALCLFFIFLLLQAIQIHYWGFHSVLSTLIGSYFLCWILLRILTGNTMAVWLGIFDTGNGTISSPFPLIRDYISFIMWLSTFVSLNFLLLVINHIRKKYLFQSNMP